MILVTGGDGEFARYIKEFADVKVLNPRHNRLDVIEWFMVREYFRTNEKNFDYVIHAAAMSRPMKLHTESPENSIETNIVGTAYISMACKMFNKKLIYISTDHVYPGIQGPYKEEDPVKPFNNYGWSKLGGECSVHMIPGSLILRMGMMSDNFPHEKAVDDMRKSCIYMGEAAKITLKLLDEEGIINIGGKGQSPYEFIKQTNPNIEAISLSEIDDVKMAKDCSMNIRTLNETLHD